MDRVASGAQCRLHDRVGPQVALHGRPGPDAHDPVGTARGQTVDVGLRCADSRLEAKELAGPHDPHRDLPAVGDQHTLHAGCTAKSGCPYSTSWAFSGTTSTIVPDTPAVTEF